jgi:hypothetical protein
MRRDLDLVRSLLLTVESDGEHPIADGYTNEEVADHAQQLLGGTGRRGFVARNHQNVPIGFTFTRLTSRGHDFIDATRNPNIWIKTKG